MDFNTARKGEILQSIAAVTALVEATDVTPDVNPLQAQVDALTAQVSALTAERDGAIAAQQAAEQRIADALGDLNAADQADATEDAARAALRTKLTGG